MKNLALALLFAISMAGCSAPSALRRNHAAALSEISHMFRTGSKAIDAAEKSELLRVREHHLDRLRRVAEKQGGKVSAEFANRLLDQLAADQDKIRATYRVLREYFGTDHRRAVQHMNVVGEYLRLPPALSTGGTADEQRTPPVAPR